jgi:cyclopropane-fatty-acyl-phospholipid synthase
MSASSASPTAARRPITASRPGRAQRSLLAMLERLTHGTLDLQAPSGQVHHFVGRDAPGALRAAIAIHDDAVFARVLQHGDIGLAEAFFEGSWTTPDLPALLRLGLLNRDSLERAIYGSRLASIAYRVLHLLHRNTRAGSRRNIHAHYDLGNEFYRLWLDPSMNYSSAWYAGDRTQSLQLAQRAKMRRALDEARVCEGSRVLEIGCGWGAVAELAASQGAHLTGVTLSVEQLEYAHRRLAAAGLAERTALRLQDYRDLPLAGEAAFDAIVSIEMFEAVGREYWASYFETVKRCLAPHGRACIQTITVRDDLFARYVKGTDFIQQYVFPGGLLPSPSAFRTEAARAGLAIERELAFGSDYAHTLRLWRHAFLQQLPRVRAQGFDTRFVRLWEFYLAYCEAAFEAGSTDVIQFTLRHAD